MQRLSESPVRLGLIAVVIAAVAVAQQQRPLPLPPPIFVRPDPEPPKPAQTQPAQPAQPQPAQAPKPAAPPAVTQTATGFVLNLQNASLTEVIDILARQLKINYILDPRVKGSVTINTYGEIRQIDIRSLLETILRINAAAMVQVGDIYRIVPVNEVSRLPLPPQVNVAPSALPDDDRMVLNLVFLKYATVAELSKLLEPFLGEGAKMTVYDAANLLLILDNARNMRRTMELIAIFDSDTFAGQRVRLFEVEHGRPSDIAKELEQVFRAVSLTDKAGAIRFLPIDRINTIIAVAPNPGVFTQVETWLKKLDVPIKVTAGTVDNYVYRVKYGRAETMAMAIMQLYLGIYSPFGYGGGYGGSGYGGGFGGGGYGYPGAYPGGAYPGGMGGYPGYPGYSGAGYGFMPYEYPGRTVSLAPPPLVQQPQAGAVGAATPQPGTAATPDLTGQYLGAAGYPSLAGLRIPRVVPNPFDNTLLIQATPQEHEQILKLLRDLDVPPRQVLIEAKIYEVTLTGAFASGVSAVFQKQSGIDPRASLTGTFNRSNFPGVSLSAATLVGQSRELLAFLSAQEDNRRAKVISAPSVIATDSIPASINVGSEVPTLTAQAVTGVQVSGSSLFANTVASRQTGVTLQIVARVNASGIVTLVINQEVSAPQAPAADAAIQSPSFSKRTVQTQVTVQDGDTIAIGGIINETDTHSSSGIPVLHRIPVLGAAFGNKSISKERTELIVFMTPRVIYDTNQITEASDELKSRFRRLQKIIRD